MFRNLVLTMAGLALAVVGYGQLRAEDCCDSGCCDSKKSCMPTIEKKKVAKKCYDDTCGTVCYPRCRFPLWSSHTCCDDCDQCDAKCGKPYKTKTLIVKTRTHEECVVKCTACETCDTCKKSSYLFKKYQCPGGCCGSEPAAEAAPPAKEGKAPEPIPAPMPK